MLCDLDDINEFLPTDKIEATDGNDAITRFQTDVDRTIKGYLGSVFTLATLQLWVAPASTPAFVRGIAGRLIAAYFYSLRFSEEIPDWDRTYPQRLYNEAMQMLDDIRTGKAVLLDVTETPATVLDDYFKPQVPAYFTTSMKF